MVLRRFLTTRMGTAAAVSAAVFLLYLVWAALAHPQSEIEQPVAGMLIVAYSVAAAGLGLRLAADVGAFDRRLRRAWFPLALSDLSIAAAALLWIALETPQQSPPSPSASDFLMLAYYPLRLAGVMLLPFAALRRSERPTLWLDLGIVFAAGFIGLWYFRAAPIWVSGSADAATLVAIAYPVADLFAVAGLVILAERGVTRVRLISAILLALNIVLVALATTALAFPGTRPLQFQARALHILWLAAGLSDLLAAAWMLQRGQRPHIVEPGQSHPARRLLRVTLPYVATLLGLAVLVVATLTDPPRPRAYLIGTVFGSIVLMALAMLRQFVVLRENLALQEETSRLATLDSLTGLHNRRALDETLEKEVERALRYTHPLAVLMLDVDGFKAFNDRHGHLQGDAALRRICECLRAQVRSTDLLARFGGDEFVLVLPETTWEGAVAVGAKMRDSTRGLLFAGSPLGLSVGVAEYRPGLSPRDLLDEVDQSLYRDKRGIGQLPLASTEARVPNSERPELTGE